MPPGLPKLMLSSRTTRRCFKKEITKCDLHVKIDIFISKTDFYLRMLIPPKLALYMNVNSFIYINPQYRKKDFTLKAQHKTI